ncbi:DUF982 domain-containing protein [Mesorhizobium sp. LMG 17147]|uniref:DUF982 domain-containing protein n=1 Tax=Mesorhizobium sp. LMG 17147 TaxID=2963091 RepID=UPI0020C95872|nr:DUF982 domain-containing protein [Mesorhizobium sp. LMG 17147]MCP9232661.1 DUF982 domain-containing protein [Mesorhizobium sp. LMG 17147]
MNQGWFSKPVAVAVGIVGDIRNISNARQAVELLEAHWRDAGSAKHGLALRTCRRAMSDDRWTEAARDAFIEAAREAHVLVERAVEPQDRSRQQGP